MKNYSLDNGGKKRWPTLLLITGVIVLMAIVASVLVIRKTYEVNLQPVSGSQKTVTVTIPTGSSVKEIGKLLEEAGVIKSSWAFEWYVRNSGLRDDLLAGTYGIRPNQNVEEIVNIIAQGKIQTDLITILPGQRLDQVRKTLINSGFSEAEVDAALDPAQYANHPALVDKPEGANLEGYLYPESFQKSADTTPQDIVKASLDEMQEVLTPSLRAAIVKQGLTVHQGIILASIIEQEVDKPEDQAVVAQVFLKRLRDGMALQSDPTAFYGAILDGQEPTLGYDSPYNTYKNKGLMPTPISNVAKSAIEAVANPSNTDYVYFVAGDDGTTYFSRTLEEHQKLTEQHCKRLCGN